MVCRTGDVTGRRPATEHPFGCDCRSDEGRRTRPPQRALQPLPQERLRCSPDLGTARRSHAPSLRSCRRHVSLELSPFFGRTMAAGVLLLAAPAILRFYVSVAGRSFIGRRFDVSDTSGASTHT